MSDRFYDNRGIEHYGVFAKQDAEDANRRYLREEKEAREQVLELQRKQVEATERAAREAERHRQEQARQQEEAEAERLAELHRHGAAAQRDRNYQNRVLFLKESDEATRLDTFVEMLVKSLDWKYYPKANDSVVAEWKAEHKQTVSLFYQLPELPKECKADGTLTRQIHTLVNNPPNSVGADAFLSEEGLRLKAESDKYDKELHRLDEEIKILRTNRSSIGCLGVLGGLLLVVGIVAFVWDKTRATEPTLAFDYCCLAIGLLLCVTPIALHPVRRSKLEAKQKQLVTLEKEKTGIAKKKDALQKFLRTLWDEAGKQAREQNRKQVTAKVATEQWMTVWRDTLTKSFFDQRLWIEDQFPNRLKEALQEIQRPYPTSCRTDVNKLSKRQIEFVFNVLTKNLADEFQSKQLARTALFGLSIDENYPLVRSLFPSHTPISYLKEGSGKRDIFFNNGVLLEFSQNLVWGRLQETLIYESLMAGPSSLSSPISNESQQDRYSNNKVATDLAGSLQTERSKYEQLLGYSFRMKVSDVFTIAGRGQVAVGVIESGKVKHSDQLAAVEIAGCWVVKEIEKNRKLVSDAQCGDSVGLLLSGEQLNELKPGVTLVIVERPFGTTLAQPIF